MTKPIILWRFGIANWLLLGLGLALLIFGFWGGLENLTLRWDRQEEYSHGYMMPILTAYFIWQKKSQLLQTEFNPTWLGFLVVFISLIVFVIGEITALFLLIHYAFIAVLIGCAWALMGNQATKIIILPLFLLVFAVPIPYFLEAQLSANLQLLSSKLGVYVIRWCDIPVYLEGNIIDLGQFKLQVVEACSGLRYLFPLMGLGFICAYLFDASFWKRAIIFLSSIPITIFMNSFRIGAIGVLVNSFGIEMAEGFIHDFEGWIVFMACMAILMCEIALFVKFGKDTRPFSEVFGLQIDEPVLNADEIKERPVGNQPFFASLFVILIACVIVKNVSQRDEIIPERKKFIDFPAQISDLKGKKGSLESSVINALKFEDYELIDFEDAQKKQVNFYTAYYKSQRKGESPHSPQVCIPGGGWQITKMDRLTFDNNHPYNRIIVAKDNIKQIVYYWFQQRGRIIANEYHSKWYLFTDALFKNRTDGALVRFTTVVYPNETEAQADARLKYAVKNIEPLLPDYLPN